MCGCGMANHGMGYVQCAEALRTDSGMRRAEQRTLIQDFNKKSEKAERTLRRLLLDWNVKKERRAARMAHAGGRHQRPGARNASGTTSPMRQAAIHMLVIDTVPYLTEEDMMRKMLSDICAAYQDTIEDALASLPSRAKMRLADHWMCSVAAAIVKLIDEIQEGEAELKKETSEAMGQLVAKVAEYYLDDRRTHLGHDPGERDITSKKAENRSRFDLDARVLASIQRTGEKHGFGTRADIKSGRGRGIGILASYGGGVRDKDRGLVHQETGRNPNGEYPRHSRITRGCENQDVQKSPADIHMLHMRQRRKAPDGLGILHGTADCRGPQREPRNDPDRQPASLHRKPGLASDRNHTAPPILLIGFPMPFLPSFFSPLFHSR